MILRLLGPQGIAGLAVSIALGLLLLIQKGETRHWQKQSAQFEQLYGGEHAAFAATVADYRAAAAQAQAADAANLQRVTQQQRAISERTQDDYQTRIAAARADAERLRREAAATPTDPGDHAATAMPGLPAAAGGAAQGAGQDRLPEADRLIATEQAIQLDELIKWIKAQAAIDTNGANIPIAP